jgi:hypothetical protein
MILPELWLRSRTGHRTLGKLPVPRFPLRRFLQGQKTGTMPSQLRPRNRAPTRGGNRTGRSLCHSAAQIEVGLLACAIFASRVCDAGNDPLTIRTDNVEQVGAAVVHLAVHQKLERRPHHRQVVIDPH